jgi:hypothetical protein
MRARIIEYRREAIGIAVRTKAGFRFFAAGLRFARLEGRRFKRLSDIDRAVRQLVAFPARPKAREIYQ